MSFILDALKKSETDRQRQGSAEFAGVPTSDRRESAPRWLWVLGALLAINLAVLLGLLLKPNSPPAAAAASSVPADEPISTGACRASPASRRHGARESADARH